MSNDGNMKGSCLCGAVKLNVAIMNKKVGACHCGMCRKWGGGPLMATDCGTEVSFEGQDDISVYDSSLWAERGFCKKCGTHLFYRLKATQQTIIPVGFFDEQKDWVFDHQIFFDKKPAFYDFANETENMTEAEVFAKFAGS